MIGIITAMLTRRVFAHIREGFQDAQIDPIDAIMFPREDDLQMIELPRTLAVRSYELLGPTKPPALFGPTAPLGQTAPTPPSTARLWPNYPLPPTQPMNPAAIREILISDISFYTDLFSRGSVPQQRRNAEFEANPGAATCAELARLATQFQTMITNLTPQMKDISGAALGYIQMKNKNLEYQRELTEQCKRNMSDACRQLAELDDSILPLLPSFEVTNTAILDQTITLQESYSLIEKIRVAMQCPEAIAMNPDLTEKGNLGFIDTTTIRNKLSELSPYFTSPAVLNYVTQYLIRQDELDTKQATTKDLITELTGYSTQINQLLPTSARIPAEMSAPPPLPAAGAGGFQQSPR